MSRIRHPFPLPHHALAEFCHPSPASPFHEPRQQGRETIVANGHLALRITKGNWFDSDIPPAEDAPEFLERIGKLDFAAPFTSPHWQPLEDVAPRLFAHGSISLWLNGKRAPSPVVFVAGRFRARLAVLQLVSRLPRAEIHTGPADPSKPLWFRFSGGSGLIARDRNLDTCGPAFAIFEPERCLYTDARLERRQRFQGLEMPGNPWPPPEPID